MNILLTSVGRRAYMVKYFQEALHGDGEVHVCNSDDMSVAFQYADRRVISPLIYDENYIPFLLDYCEKNQIQMVVSLFDLDLPALARNKDKFSAIGTAVIVSSPEFIEICNDKWKTHTFLTANGFKTPKTYLKRDDAKRALSEGEIRYPVIIKPRFGCGSIAFSVAHDDKEFESYDYLVKNMIQNSYLKYMSAVSEDMLIYQEMLDGQEYGVDVINDLNGGFKNAIVKKKLVMRSGETDIAETVSHDKIYSVAEKLAALSKHIGNMDCDFVVHGQDIYIIELNARFGGGYPFSHIAGCNLPEALVKWCKNAYIDSDLLTAEIGVRSYKELAMVNQRKGETQ